MYRWCHLTNRTPTLTAYLLLLTISTDVVSNSQSIWLFLSSFITAQNLRTWSNVPVLTPDEMPMAQRPLRNYLRSHRRRWALSQEQLSVLLGFRSAAQLSKFERNERLPNLKTALAFEIIFGVPLGDICEGLRAEVEEEVMRRAYALYERLEHQEDPTSLRNRELLMEMLARATNKPNP